MKRYNSLYWLLLLFVGLLTSCEEYEVLQVLEEEQEAVQAVSDEQEVAMLVDYQAAMDAQRAKKPQRTNSQTEETENYGEKGRDRRDWFHNWSNERLKSLDTGSVLSIGELYAIDPDGVNPYIFKFYFPEELGDKSKEYLGMSVSVMIYSTNKNERAPIKTVFHTESLSLDDSFRVSRSDWNDWYYIRYSFRRGYSVDSSSETRETTFNDMVIIKGWH